MKLWRKGSSELDRRIEAFTVGDDPLLDLELVRHDCVASKAHARMLCSIGVLDAGELAALLEGLDEILALEERGEFTIREEDEDCHTAIENYLVERCGDAGKKIHTGRSRNDQVLTALRLWEKEALAGLRELLGAYGDALRSVIERQGDVALPGYTHMQKAMPTTVGTWLGAFVIAAEDDAGQLEAALALADQCPLGTAAGFGVPVLELDRERTAKELGFARVQENPIHAQHSRGKFEAVLLGVCSQILYDLNKLASDLVLYNMSEFGYVRLPETICTGSSIMPQKRNPDVLELVRAKYHVVLAKELEVKSLMGNLISGYNRDLQLTKEPLFTGLGATVACLEVIQVVLAGLEIDEEACARAMTAELFATERAYELVKQGVPFREAYRIAAQGGEKE